MAMNTAPLVEDESYVAMVSPAKPPRFLSEVPLPLARSH